MNTDSHEPIDLITMEQAADLLGMTVNQVRELVRHGELQTHEVRTVRLLILRADLDQLTEDIQAAD